ncbi:MAG: hypothetical protein BWX49_00722 [Bacteroidetes bacterium ADurb.Bin008]|jgi:hypothetical protein|nr:MAG: hypothetical protein BWX49_00722 [Bacteroidetes bacterium ADurb.Bin008]
MNFNELTNMIPLKKFLIKITAFLWFGGLICSVSHAQEVNYKDLYNQIGTLEPQQLYYRLFLYQNQNPHFANTYIQLGYTAEMILQNLDPLREFELANYWVGNVVLYYSLFPRFVEEDKVRKNREFYANIPIETAGKRVEDQDVLNYVNQKNIFYSHYKDSVNLIYKSLEQSKDHYNNCIRLFNQINEKYENYNEALLRTDNTLLSSLESLKNEFNRSIESFNNYKSLINAYPIAGHNQAYRLKNIETYRLDGIINSDFLKDTFDLWDYGKWINDFMHTYNNDIVSLRHEISSIQKMFVDNKRKISLAQTILQDEKYPSFDDLFLFRLGKYDNNSLVRELFKYLEGRQSFLILEKSPLNNPDDSTSDLMNRKLRFYHRLAQELTTTERMLNTLKGAIDNDKVARFKEFFEQQYGGETGLKNFTNQEMQFLIQSMDSDLENLRVYLTRESLTKSMLGNAAGARGVSIPLNPIPQSSQDSKTQPYLTRSVFDILGEPKYTSGAIRRANMPPMAFAAKIGTDKKVEWVREIGAKGKNAIPDGDCASHIVGFEQGCMVVVSGTKAENEYVNTLIRLDDKGRDVFSSNINIDALPVYYNFDDINQISIFGFATKVPDSNDLYHSFTIAMADSLGSIQWQTDIDIQGQLVDIVKAEGKYLAFFNFTSLDLNGKKLNAGKSEHHMAHVIVELSDNGRLLGNTPILSDESFCINRIFSISSNEINLLGYCNNSDQSDAKLKYLIVTDKCDILYKNF